MVFVVDAPTRPVERQSEAVLDGAHVGRFSLALFRLRHSLTQRAPYVGLLGIISLILAWYLLTEFFNLPRFNKLPGPVAVWKEFPSREPTYGISIYTPNYYMHIFSSVWRVLHWTPTTRCRSSFFGTTVFRRGRRVRRVDRRLIRSALLRQLEGHEASVRACCPIGGASYL